MRKSDILLLLAVFLCSAYAYILVNKVDLKLYFTSFDDASIQKSEQPVPFRFSPTPADFDGIPRTIVALYDSKHFPRTQYTLIHNFAEMPLNHLGLVVEYHDIRAGFPNLNDRKDVRGILTWFRSEEPMDNPDAYLKWAISQIKQGRKYVVMGLPGFRSAIQQRKTSISNINEFYKLLGLEYVPYQHVRVRWKDLQNRTIPLFTAFNPKGVGFEYPLEKIDASYHTMHQADAYLRPYIQSNKTKSNKVPGILASTHPNGGVVESGFEIYANYSSSLRTEKRSWIINPFIFFADAFNTDELPKPDTTTLFGRRIFYSHIDGDGWNGLSGNCEKYGSCAQALKTEVLDVYPNVPVTIAPIAGDLNSVYGGSAKARHIAKNIFNLPHVEPASHTYTHPMKWAAFEGDNHYVNPMDVREYKKQGYDQMRLYTKRSFSTKQEVVEATREIERLAPDNKPIQLVQWSGDTSPGEEALKLAFEAKLHNINGGDTRFDSQFNSYAWVKPIGLRQDNYVQIYASNSNENTYTNGWSAPFYGGLKKLRETWDNTESPVRIKPMNLYYHVFTAQHDSGIEAVKSLLEYAYTQPIIPTKTSRYAAIANGFFSAQIISLGKQSWQVRNRGGLQTIRFDSKDQMHVDIKNSDGVLGYRHYQDSLYVYLDAAVNEPVITLTDTAANTMYLIESSWHISALKKDKEGVSFTAHGYGDGKIQWHVDRPGDYKVNLKDTAGKEVWSGNIKSQTDGVLSLILPTRATAPLNITIRSDAMN